MGPNANIKAVISAEDNASRVLAGFGHTTHALAKGLIIGVAAASAATAAFAATSVKAFTESQDAIAQTNATLKSTGGIAGITSDQVGELASSLQRVTKFSDEQIRSGENLLLTFTKIGKDIFPQATEVMLDMSQALGQDVKSSAIQLGKALQDPILGVTALRRVGVNFNEEAQKTIKNLVDTGRAAEAQKFILKELQTEFGGSARAAGQTFAGQLIILKNQFNDLQETVGLFIVNAITPLITKLAQAASAIDWQAVIQRTSDAIKIFWNNYLVPFAQAIANVAIQVGNYLLPKFEALWNTITTRLTPALVNLWQGVIQPLLPVIGTALVVAVGLAIDAINLLITVLSPLINWLGQNSSAVYGVIGAITTWYLLMKAHDAFLAMQAIITATTGVIAAHGGAVGSVQAAYAGLNAYLAGFTGFAIVAAAAGAAAFIIINEANKAKAAWDEAHRSIDESSAIVDASLKKLKDKIAAARASGDKAAEDRALKALRSVGTPGVETRQHGGPVASGHPYLVGEQGPELFVPKNSGNIVPGKLGGGGTVNLNVNIGMYAGSPMEKREIARSLFKAFQDVSKQYGVSPSQLLDGSNGVIIR